MTVQTFRNLLKKQPFAPFRIVMSSGEKYEIPHPEMAWIVGSDLLVGTRESRHGHPMDYTTCSMLHITAIESLDSPSKSKKNGRKNGS